MTSKQRDRNVLKEYIKNYLIIRKCVGVEHYGIKCSESDPCCLEFDHVDPSQKKFTISKAVRARVSLPQLKTEIEKCVVRCANCHKKRHFMDKNNEKIAQNPTEE